MNWSSAPLRFFQARGLSPDGKQRPARAESTICGIGVDAICRYRVDGAGSC